MSERDDIAPLLDDLARTLDSLREELAGGHRGGVSRRPVRERPRSPPPRPPTPGELFQFTEEYTIPTLIALLEATVRALELLQAVMRVAGGRGLRGVDRSPGDRVGETGRRALDTLDTVLADLQDAIEGQPTDPRARELLTEARDLRRDIDDTLGTSGRDNRDRAPSRDRAGSGTGGGDEPVRISVETEGEQRDRPMTAGRSSTPDDRTRSSPQSADAGQGSIEDELETIKRQLGKSGGSPNDADESERE